MERLHFSAEVDVGARETGGICEVGHDANLGFDWNPVAPHLIHPVKVAIIEALSYMNQPLSADELRQLLGNMQYVSTITHHIKGLMAAEALVMVGTSRVRGATKKRYFLLVRD